MEEAERTYGKVMEVNPPLLMRIASAARFASLGDSAGAAEDEAAARKWVCRNSGTARRNRAENQGKKCSRWTPIRFSITNTE